MLTVIADTVHHVVVPQDFRPSDILYHEVGAGVAVKPGTSCEHVDIRAVCLAFHVSAWSVDTT